MQPSAEANREFPFHDPINPTTSRTLEDTARSSPLPSRPTSSASTRTPKSLNKRNFRGETQLLVLARKGDVVQCSQLISDGADVNLGDNAGWTPLHEACTRGHFAVAELLIRNSADVNAKSADGVCPLHDAIHVKDPKLVWLLLANGADPDMPSSEGPLPVDMEEARAVKEIALLLQTKPVPEAYPFEESQATSVHKESSPISRTSSENMSSSSAARFEASSTQMSNLSADKETSEGEEGEIEDSRSGTATPTSSARAPIHTSFSLKRRGAKTVVHACPRPSPSSSTRSLPQRPKNAFEDVYEFRSSPESEDDTPGPTHAKLNITFGAAAGEKVSPTQMTFYPPAPKRPRPDDSTAAAGSTLEAENSDSSVDDEADDASATATDAVDQLAVPRKVPPLRISLTKTPSEEDGGNAGEVDDGDGQLDDSAAYRGSKGRRPCPGRKGHHHEKDSTQRLTRSRLRQAGANIDEVARLGTKKKGNHNRRGSATATLGTSAAANPEKAPSASPAPEGPEDEASRSSAGGDSESGGGQSTSATLALFSKNDFDAFHEMRGMIESKWVDGYLSQREEQSRTALPAELINKLKQFASFRRKESDDSSATIIYVGKNWPQSLQSLAEQQAHKRDELQRRQKVERDRLLTFAEREYIRQTRTTIPPQRLISAVRIVRDSEIYNPLVLDDPEPQQPPPLSKNQLRQRLTNMSVTTKNRHVMEAQSLLALQMSEWEQAVRKAEETGYKLDRKQVTAGDYVRSVPVEEVKFAFLR